MPDSMQIAEIIASICFALIFISCLVQGHKNCPKICCMSRCSYLPGSRVESKSLLWIVGCPRYLIWKHPEVEAKLVAELDQAGLLVTRERPHPRPMEYADLSGLTYLSWVCKVGWPAPFLMDRRPICSSAYAPCTCLT